MGAKNPLQILDCELPIEKPRSLSKDKPYQPRVRLDGCNLQSAICNLESAIDRWGCYHGWCRAWSSKPAAGRTTARIGFDSHTSPFIPKSEHPTLCGRISFASWVLCRLSLSPLPWPMISHG